MAYLSLLHWCMKLPWTKMPFISDDNLDISEQTSLHIFGVFFCIAKSDYFLNQIHLLKCYLLYLTMTSICIKGALGASVALIFAICHIIVFLIN